MTTFLDTNIIIALLDENHSHHTWSVTELVNRKAEGPAIVSDIVYCEVGVGMADKASLDAAIEALGLERFPSKDEALFRAGQAFLKYRRDHQGQKLGVLPDFLIGAVAEIEETPLMTINSKDFTGYFPGLRLITPPPPVHAQAAVVMPAFGADGAAK